MSTSSTILMLNLKEFYWTVTRAVGLGFLHDGSPVPAFLRFWQLIKRIEATNKFQTEQLPMVLRTLSDLNSRMRGTDNLVKSVPVALREFARELREFRAIEAARDRHENELRDRLESLARSAHYLDGRIEFVRRELMFEMRYGARVAMRPFEPLKTQTKILAPEVVAAARTTGLHLNLGCGHIALDGYVNIDRRELPGVAIVAEVDELPFAHGEVDEIFSAHLLEHFPHEELVRRLLPYWKSLLKAGGKFRAVVPDAEAMAKGFAEGTYAWSAFREVTFGMQDYDGDFHFDMFTPDSLILILEEQGFRNIELIERGRRNGACYEFEIVGYA